MLEIARGASPVHVARDDTHRSPAGARPPRWKSAKRSPGMKSSDAKFCESSYQTDFNTWIASGADPSLVPGTDVFCQWFMRDPTNPFSSASSNALWFQVGP